MSEYLPELCDFIAGHPHKRVPLIEDVVAADSARKNFTPTHLRDVGNFADEFGTDSKAYKLLISSDRLNEVISYLKHSPENKSFVQQLVDKDTPLWRFSQKSMADLATIYKAFGADSEAVNKLHLRAADGVDLTKVATAIRMTGATGTDLLAKLVDQNAEESKLHMTYLEPRIELEKIFGAGSKTVNALDRVVASELNLAELLKFVVTEPEHPSSLEQRKQVVSDLVNSGAPSADLRGNRLAAVERLKSLYGSDSATINSILQMEADGKLVPDQLVPILGPFRSTVDLLPVLIEQGATGSQLSYGLIRQYQAIEPVLHPDEEMSRRLIALQGQSLNLHSLAEYVSKEPRERVSIVEKLIRSGASVKALSNETLNAHDDLRASRAAHPEITNASWS